MHITTGIDAIHEIDATWDEKRGRLYPPNWYKHFNLYDMHGKDEPAEAPAPDSPQVPEDNDENSPDKAEDESKAEGGAGGELFVAFWAKEKRDLTYDDKDILLIFDFILTFFHFSIIN